MENRVAQVVRVTQKRAAVRKPETPFQPVVSAPVVRVTKEARVARFVGGHARRDLDEMTGMDETVSELQKCDWG